MTALAHDLAGGWDALPGRAFDDRLDGSRPTLYLVPGGRSARPSRPTTPLRASRFGRLVLTGTAVGVAALAVVLMGMVFGVGTARASIDHTVIVRSGQTLSGIAATELPDLPMAEGVAQIQLANHLNTSQVHVNQQLGIPSIR